MEVMMLKAPAAEDEICPAHEEGTVEVGKVSAATSSERSPMEAISRPSPSNTKESITTSQEEQLEYTKSEMGEVREENQRLKMILAQIVKDYQYLQKQYFDILQQEQSKKALETAEPDGVEEPELVLLSLGTSSTGQKKEEINTCKDSGKDGEGLTLGLDCKFEGTRKSPNEHDSTISPDNSSDDPKEEEPGEPWPPSKILKNPRNGDDEGSQQPQVKKARVSVRARCDAPTMNDGCQWRKYGQKVAKGNPCPRAYYRCTVAPGCPVRKQVQRCAEDMSILITTYEGTHNHPLPLSATTMACTTAAAASMLMTGSSTSGQGMAPPAIGPLCSSSTAAAASTSLHGLNFGMLGSSNARQPYLPIPSISSTPSYPTITLDLTAPPSATSQLNQFTRFPRYSSTGFNFSSESTTIPTSWSNGYLSYASQAYNKGSNTGSLSLGRQSQDSFYHSILQKAINSVAATTITAVPSPSPNQHALTDTIAKAITSDPSFQSAIAAAITSYVGGQPGREGASHDLLKLGGHFNSSAVAQLSAAVNGCASSYLNRSSSSSSSHQPNLPLLQPPLAFPTPKTASADRNSESID
ncbi:WRKY transcription factor 72A-like isoform X1 [Musa acuminata AAA Group]|uniref:WRKY transcription factor 72A-like isoform X1 n=2 Tax=Musa acuminata AAA Group TaxID=214697 RepID=UPI0031D369DA